MVVSFLGYWSEGGGIWRLIFAINELKFYHWLLFLFTFLIRHKNICLSFFLVKSKIRRLFTSIVGRGWRTTLASLRINLVSSRLARYTNKNFVDKCIFFNFTQFFSSLMQNCSMFGILNLSSTLIKVFFRIRIWISLVPFFFLPQLLLLLLFIIIISPPIIQLISIWILGNKRSLSSKLSPMGVRCLAGFGFE